MTKIRKAVLPVAGLGTRVLPATKSIPKEMLPVFDRPAIQYVVEEAREAGIEHIVFVTGRNKSAIEDFFDRAYELEDTLRLKGKTDILDTLEAEVYFRKLLGQCGIDPVPEDWRERVKVGADRKQSGTARENLSGLPVEIPDVLPEAQKKLVEFMAPGLRKLLGYE